MRPWKTSWRVCLLAAATEIRAMHIDGAQLANTGDWAAVPPIPFINTYATSTRMNRRLGVLLVPRHARVKSSPISAASDASRQERLALCTILANWFFDELERDVAPHSLGFVACMCSSTAAF